MRVVTTLALAGLLLTASVSFGQTATYPAGVQVEQTASGPVLADAKGMTLYTFDNDKIPGQSACNGPCAANWPPLAAAPNDSSMGAWTVVTRADGSSQWAYNGKPLYTWIKDTKPGDTTGDNFKNIWHVAKP